VRRWGGLIVVAVVALALWWGGLQMRRDTATDVKEREAIRVTDTLYRTATDTLRVVRTRTDSVLTVDTLIHMDTVRVLVERERNACDAVVSACEAQKAALKARIKTLESRSAGWLFLYGEAGGALQNASLPTLEGEAGAAVRVDASTYIQGAVTTHGDIRLTVRRQLKLF
jgi:DNA replication initiation complex subunit (GINS family)